MANPNPVPPPKEGQWKPGQSGNPKGREPGTRSLSTIIRALTESPPDWGLLPLKGSAEMAEKYKNKSAWEAIIYVALGQAMAGDQQARDFLAKRGYGDKIDVDVTSGGKPIPILAALNVSTDDSPTEDTPTQ